MRIDVTLPTPYLPHGADREESLARHAAKLNRYLTQFLPEATVQIRYQPVRSMELTTDGDEAEVRHFLKLGWDILRRDPTQYAAVA